MYVMGNAQRDGGKTRKALWVCTGGPAKVERWKLIITGGYSQL